MAHIVLPHSGGGADGKAPSFNKPGFRSLVSIEYVEKWVFNIKEGGSLSSSLLSLWLLPFSLPRLQEDPPTGVSGAPSENNIMLWNAVIFG